MEKLKNMSFIYQKYTCTKEREQYPVDMLMFDASDTGDLH